MWQKIGPGLSVKLPENSFQDFATIMVQVRFLGFITQYYFNKLT